MRTSALRGDKGSDARSRRVARHLEKWFATNARPLPWREKYDAYHVWVSEVMLQQTRMEVVLGYFARFVAAFPTVEALAVSDEQRVLALWSGLGYYRRARMLRAGAVEVVRQFGGVIPSRVEELLSIPGVGRYTAGAIASIAYDHRAPIVDGNVARVVARLDAIEEPMGTPAFTARAWSVAEELVKECSSPRALNQGLMELGALVCTPSNPKCGRCPLRRDCRAFQEGTTAILPRKKAAVATRSLRIPLYLISDSRGRILMRRESGQLMTDMLHLPHGNELLIAAEPLEVVAVASCGTFRHSVTTRRIEFEIVTARLTQRRVGRDYEWIEPSMLSTLPHPSYVAKALRLAGKVSPSMRASI